MPPGSLREDQQAHDNKGGNHRRGDWPTECQPAIADGFVEKVADSCTQRPGEDEGSPKQRYPRHACSEIEYGDHREPRGEDERAAFIAKAAGVGQPVSERSTKRLRK